MARRKVKKDEKNPWGQCLTRPVPQVFWHQSEARTAATIWNWSGKTLSPGALLAVLYFSSCHIFFRPFRLFLIPTICPWVSKDARTHVHPGSFKRQTFSGLVFRRLIGIPLPHPSPFFPFPSPHATLLGWQLHALMCTLVASRDKHSVD